MQKVQASPARLRRGRRAARSRAAGRHRVPHRTAELLLPAARGRRVGGRPTRCSRTRRRSTADAMTRRGHPARGWRAVIAERRKARSGDARTSRASLAKGEDAILKKIGEEAAETLLAAKDGDKLHLIAETADLWFHCMVLLAWHGVRPDDVLAELRGAKAPPASRKRRRRSKQGAGYVPAWPRRAGEQDIRDDNCIFCRIVARRDSEPQGLRGRRDARVPRHQSRWRPCISCSSRRARGLAASQGRGRRVLGQDDGAGAAAGEGAGLRPTASAPIVNTGRVGRQDVITCTCTSSAVPNPLPGTTVVRAQDLKAGGFDGWT